MGQFEIVDTLACAGADIKDVFSWEKYGILHFPFHVIPNIIQGITTGEQSPGQILTAARRVNIGSKATDAEAAAKAIDTRLAFMRGSFPTLDRTPKIRFSGNTPEKQLASYDVALSEFITTMIKQGADPNLESGNGITPLLLALHHKCPRSAITLVQGGANVNYVSQNGWSVVDAAYKTEDQGLIKFLIEKGMMPPEEKPEPIYYDRQVLEVYEPYKEGHPHRLIATLQAPAGEVFLRRNFTLGLFAGAEVTEPVLIQTLGTSPPNQDPVTAASFQIEGRYACLGILRGCQDFEEFDKRSRRGDEFACLAGVLLQRPTNDEDGERPMEAKRVRIIVLPPGIH